MRVTGCGRMTRWLPRGWGWWRWRRCWGRFKRDDSNVRGAGMPFEIQRRTLLQAAAIGLGAVTLSSPLRLLAAEDKVAEKKQLTRFQVACMTLPYGQYPLARALAGIQKTGYKFVAWGTTHKEEGESKAVPVMPADASPAKAKELGQKCRDLGLEPLMMFSGIYPEDPKAMEVF